MARKVFFEDLGLMDYKACWDLQERVFKKTVDQKIANRKEPETAIETESHLFFVEHPHVYTLGKSGDVKNLLLDEVGLASAEAQFYPINRGGDITYHGPGQIVAYPIMDLDHYFTDIHKYLRFLEEAVMLTLQDYGVPSGRVEGLTGVWIEGENPDKARKICALGVKCSRWVTMHGLAFNINANLDYFGHIIPCGIDDKAVTSLDKELGRPVDMQEAKTKLLGHLAQLFDFEIAKKNVAFARYAE